MTHALLRLGRSALLGLAEALASGRLGPPFTRSSVSHHIPDEHREVVLAALAEMHADGMAARHIAHALGLLAEERAAEQRMSDRVQLVWSPPELDHVDARDTVVVVQDLFRAAKKSILIVSYVLDAGKKAETLFGELAARMDNDPNLAVRIFVNIKRERHDNTASSELIKKFVERVRKEVWPGKRLPDFFYDPRSLVIISHQGASLHAKCVVTDGRWTLLTSANFTEAAQERNIEAGVLLDDPTFAQRVTRQFDLLVEDETLQPLDVGVRE